MYGGLSWTPHSTETQEKHQGTASPSYQLCWLPMHPSQLSPRTVSQDAQGSVLFVSTSIIFSQTVLQRDIFDFLFLIICLFSHQLFSNMLLGKIDMVQAILRGITL